MDDHVEARPFPTRFFAMLIVVTVACFVGAALYGQRALAAIDVDTHAIVLGAMPTVRDLSSARAALARLEGDIDGYAFARAAGAPDPRHALTRERRELGARIDAFSRRSETASQKDVLAAIRSSLQTLDRSVAVALLAADAGDRATARDVIYTRVHPTLEQLDGALMRLIETAAQRAAERAVAIGRTRRHAARIAAALDAASVLVAGIGLVFALAIAGRYARALAASRRDLVARANELERFAGRAAHDLRAPLTAILFHAEVGKSSTSSPSFDRIARSVERAGVLIQALLDFATAGAHASAHDQAQLDEVIAGVLDDLALPARDAGVAIELHAEAHPTVACAPGALASVLANLVGNAVTHAACVPPERRRVSVHVRAVGRQARIEVVDQGPGVPQELGAAIFEPFVRGPSTGRSGFGLGLATAKRIVEACGGRIGVDSRLGAGSCFWFEVPTVKAT